MVQLLHDERNVTHGLFGELGRDVHHDLVVHGEHHVLVVARRIETHQ